MKRKTIVISDGDLEVDQWEAALSRDYDVVTARDANALATALLAIPDVVLFDMTASLPSGGSLASKLGELPFPCIALVPHEKLVPYALKRGAAEVLMKPLTAQQLASAVERVLGARTTRLG